MASNGSRICRLTFVIAISFTFFLVEISIGIYTHSLALVADAFHYLNDVIGFAVALIALNLSRQNKSPKSLTFGWQRATLLGAFFNGVFLLALGVSIFLQSIERFVVIEELKNPILVLIVGAVGLFLNIVSFCVLHEHSHGHLHGHSLEENRSTEQEPGKSEDQAGGHIPLPNLLPQSHEGHLHRVDIKKREKRDFGMMGVLLHVFSDALNNLGVMIVGVLIWQLSSSKRHYADPAIGLAIGISIVASSYSLIKNSGAILLQCAPKGINLDDIRDDLMKIRNPDIVSVHELHVWRLNQEKTVASAHIVLENADLALFIEQAKTVSECLHAYGIHSVTLQPEIASRAGSTAPTTMSTSTSTPPSMSSGGGGDPVEIATTTAPGTPPTQDAARSEEYYPCQITCGTSCERLTCCG